MPSPEFYNTCWMLSCLTEARAFRRASQRVAQSQMALLEQILANNSTTAWGTRHGFKSIRSIDDFRRQVPLTRYEDYSDLIAGIAAGEKAVLTADPVELLEPTSGTTSGEKLVPYTAGLRKSFQRAIRAWMWNLFYNRPTLRTGTAYWSISPLASAGRMTSAGIRIGFDDDSAYLGSFERRMLIHTLAVPPEIALCKSVSAAQYATLYCLLRDPELALMSVWSPTFLLQLFSCLRSNAESLCADIECGLISREHADSLPDSLTRPRPPLPGRARELRRVFDEWPTEWVKRIWPRLSLVSCWADGPSALYADALSQMLPGIEIQPKGLLATEAVVTIPLLGHSGAALAVRSHFFEFQPVDGLGQPIEADIVMAHELDLGSEYRVVVTTAGGLYRYQLNDQVRVVGFHRQLPLLEFMGKADDTTDLVGEKLSVVHVQQVIADAIQKFSLRPTFLELSPELNGVARYVLRIADAELGRSAERQLEFGDSIDQALMSNPGYRYARDLGQLGHLQLHLVTQNEGDRISEQRTAALLRSGMRYGNIKPAIISKSARPNHSGSCQAD
jgi:hypothetical protein